MIVTVNGNEEISRQLVAAGVALDQKNISGDTALIIAVRSGHSAQVKQLLNGGADASIRNQRGEYAHGLAQAAGQTEIIEMLDHQPNAKKRFFGVF